MVDITEVEMPLPHTSYRPARKSLSLLSGLTILVTLVAGPRAQNPPAKAPPSAAVQQGASQIKVDVDLVLFEASVWDKDGKTMDMLNREDFALLADGVPQSIVHFSKDELPLAVVLVVDVSGSMEDVMSPLRKAALVWLDKLKPEDRVALFTFTDSAKLEVPLTKDKTKVATAIRQFLARGNTDIHQALDQAAAYLRKEAPQERRTIILVSDDFAGGRRGGKSSYELMRSLQKAGTTLYNLKIYNPDETQVPQEIFEQMDVVHIPWMARQTGGVMEEVKGKRSISDAFGALISILKTRYTLGFYPKMDPGDTSFHILDLQLVPSLGQRGKDYKIIYKDGYYATAAQ